MEATEKRQLPPDPEGQNDNREAWAEKAIRAFIRATNTDREDALCDLLADLMHWADRQGQDFNRELDRARMHYTEETASDDDDDLNSIEAARHYMEKSDDPGHGADSDCKVCRFHLEEGAQP